MAKRVAGRGRKPIDPAGDTKAITVRLPAAVKAALDDAAARNGRSVSQEITSRLTGGSSEEPASALVGLVAAFEERLVLFCGADWTDPQAAAALAAGLSALLARIAPASSAPKEAEASRTGAMVGGLTYDWLQSRNEPEVIALRKAFLGASA